MSLDHLNSSFEQRQDDERQRQHGDWKRSYAAGAWHVMIIFMVGMLVGVWLFA